MLFGLISAGLPRTYEELIKTHPRDVRAALLRARRGNDLSPQHDAQVEATLERFRSTVLSSAAAAFTPARASLAYALSSSTRAKAFIEAYLEHEEHDDRAFWAKLGRRPAPARGELIARAKFALRAGVLEPGANLHDVDRRAILHRARRARRPADRPLRSAPRAARRAPRHALERGHDQARRRSRGPDLGRVETLLDGAGAPDEAPGPERHGASQELRR
ncbi:MAG: hypothetical protein U0359_07515 [Byssovorax sp.]